MQHSRQCWTSCVIFRAWLFFRIILSVKFERSSQNTKEGTHHWNRRVLFNGTVPQHPIFWQQFIPHDHVDTLVLVEHNDVVCLTFQTIGDVHCLHQIIQRQCTLNEQRKEQHFVNEDIEADRFSSEVFEPKGSINKKSSIVPTSSTKQWNPLTIRPQFHTIRLSIPTVQRCWESGRTNHQFKRSVGVVKSKQHCIKYEVRSSMLRLKSSPKSQHRWRFPSRIFYQWDFAMVFKWNSSQKVSHHTTESKARNPCSSTKNTYLYPCSTNIERHFFKSFWGLSLLSMFSLFVSR